MYHYSEEEVLIAKLSRADSDVLNYTTYEKYLDDLPMLERLGYVRLHNGYAGDVRFFIKVTALRSFDVTYGQTENFSGMIARHEEGKTRVTSVEVTQPELIAFLLTI